MVVRATFDTLRSINFSAISGTYADIGSATTELCRGFNITNNTDGDIIVSIDGGTTDQLFIAAGSFILWDVQSNMNVNKDDKMVLPIGTQFSVKQSTAPTEGDVYVMLLQKDTTP